MSANDALADRQLASPVLEVTSTHVSLASAVAVDTRELEAYAERVYGPGVQEAAKWLEQVDDLLPDWYDDWVLQERERLREVRLLALEAASYELIDAGLHSEGALAARAVIGVDPLRESAYRLLIRAHLDAGNAAEALRQFGLFRAQLSETLGLEPSAQMHELLRSARLGS